MTNGNEIVGRLLRSGDIIDVDAWNVSQRRGNGLAANHYGLRAFFSTSQDLVSKRKDARQQDETVCLAGYHHGPNLFCGHGIEIGLADDDGIIVLSND